MKKIVAINLGSTSTKIAYYENDLCIIKDNIPHSAEDLKSFKTFWDQKDYRKKNILEFLAKNNIDVKDLDAFVSRGGHTKPITSGVYHINKEMLKESRSEVYGNHISDVGILIASEFENEKTIALTVDTPVTDEFLDIAKYSGLPEIKRKSSFQVLNNKAVARQYAKDINTNYEDLNLLVVHLGGGITVAAHQKGKMIDATNGLLGEGPFSTNRTGGLPVGDLMNMCFSGKFTKDEVKQKLNGLGGLMAYVGDNNTKNVADKAISGDIKSANVLDAMMYQTAKEVGAMATVLNGNVDAILLTGGMAKSDYLMDLLTKRISFIAPIKKYPGELEMESLCLCAYKALNKEMEIKEIN